MKIYRFYDRENGSTSEWDTLEMTLENARDYQPENSVIDYKLIIQRIDLNNPDIKRDLEGWSEDAAQQTFQVKRKE